MQVAGLVRDDRQQPRAQRRVAAEVPQLVERLHERLLHHVLGVVAGPEQDRRPVCERGVPGDQRLIGVQVTGARPGHCLGVVQLAPPLLVDCRHRPVRGGSGLRRATSGLRSEATREDGA